MVLKKKTDELENVSLLVRNKISCDEIIDHRELLLLAEKVVQRYAYTIPKSDREDIRMSMVENFLKQKEKITSQFQGNSKTNTYCTAILNRMCCSIIRKELSHWKSTSNIEVEDDSLSTDHESTATQLLINDEIEYLRRLLLIQNDKHKTTIFLAFYYLLATKSKFLKSYDKQYKAHQLPQLLRAEDVKSKSYIFETLSKVVNCVENKSIKADAVRMWLNKQRSLMIARLNGPFERASYDKDSFQVLFEFFYQKN